MLVADC